MRITRIYQAGHYDIHDVIDLSTEAGQHIGVVLRKQIGEKLILFSGDNREWDAEIVAIHKKKVTVHIIATHIINRESPRIIRLAQAMAKSERMAWLVQKAVELGVTEINPLITQYGAYKLEVDRLTKKHQQWQAIAIAACEQCGRNQVPKVTFPRTLESFLQQERQDNAYVLEPHHGKSYREYKEPVGSLTLMIGPEGGFSPKEFKHIITAGFMPLKLGPRILRTETATVSALSVVQAVWGDL